MIKLKSAFSKFRKFRLGEAGVAAVELALCAPLLLLLFYGTIEVTRYYLATQKTEKTIDIVADVVARSDRNTAADDLTLVNLNSLMFSVDEMMNPYGFGPNGKIILTDVSKANDGNVKINWQFCGGGTAAATSNIGTIPGNVATLPATFTGPMLIGEEVMIGEIFYDFHPLLVQDIIGPLRIYRSVYFTPRFNPLNTFVSSCS